MNMPSGKHLNQNAARMLRGVGGVSYGWTD